MNSGPSKILAPRRRAMPSRLSIALLLGGLALATPVLGQEKPQDLKGVLGRVQSDAEKRAVDDLVGKLKGVARKPGEPGAPTPAAAAPGGPGPTATPAPAATPAPSTTPEPGVAGTSPPAPTDRVATPATPTPSPQPEAAPAPAAPMTPEEAVKKAETKQVPSVDFEIFFAYNSAEITSESEPTLTTLGRALRDAELADDQFLIAGHTDSKGGRDYNQGLSQRRAESVRQYLITNFGIDGKNLVAKGFGFKHLKTPRQPLAAENRRVQIVNMSKDMPETSRR
jgi:outer membrane protein OmpA-like peptidoglycan-associated protein